MKLTPKNGKNVIKKVIFMFFVPLPVTICLSLIFLIHIFNKRLCWVEVNIQYIISKIEINLFLDFNLYRDTILRILRGPSSNFVIGIYGEWGTGKTTLMQSIFNLLRENNADKSLIPVWFNAWQYEGEEYFVLIPLLKTIELAIPDTVGRLKESLRDAGIFGLKISKNFISNFIGSYLGSQTGKYVGEGLDTFLETILPKLKKIDEIEKNTIYFDGQRKIKKEIENARSRFPNLKIVVFIDDLDRCSPQKVIEIFESIKLFLGMDGFVYVLGLSHDKIFPKSCPRVLQIHYRILWSFWKPLTLSILSNSYRLRHAITLLKPVCINMLPNLKIITLCDSGSLVTSVVCESYLMLLLTYSKSPYTTGHTV